MGLEGGFNGGLKGASEGFRGLRRALKGASR